jgi:catechol 2,3-dioxygenase-like lactoylglutathione lyase family enzyme/ketosteroid isomerase-like protein
MIENDPGAIGEFIADDWVIVGQDGSVCDKERFLALVASGELSHNVMETHDMKVRIYGDTAVAVARGVSGGHYRSEPFLLAERSSCVFVKQAGRWRCVLTHLSSLADGPPVDSPKSKPSQRVVPALRVRSYEASTRFYAKLGFEERWRHQFASNLPVFASMTRDDMQLFLTEHAGDCQFGGLVHFYVEDVDACHAEFCAAGVAVSQPPGNSLGPDIRDMLVVDPDGNRLSFITLAKASSR